MKFKSTTIAAFLLSFLLPLSLLLPSPLPAQIPSGFVDTTATVPSLANASLSASWTNLSSSPQLPLLGGVSTFPTTASARLDSNGHFSILLADTAQVIPTPSTWTFNFIFNCPPDSAGPGGFTVQVAVTGGGGTQDITGQVTSALPSNPCGGGGGSGSIVASPHLSLGYYVTPGTASTIQGDQFVFTDGSGHMDAKRIGKDYDIIPFGAQPCPFDSTSAIQSAINAAGGSPLQFPAGKWCISAPLMYYTVPPAAGGYAPGPTFHGAGHDRTQLLALPSFTVPTSVTFSGLTAYPAPAMIDVQGVVAATATGGFQENGEISGIQFAPYGCETYPSVGEPACAYITPPAWITGGHNGIEAISYEGIWYFKIFNNDIKYMSGDAIIAPDRLDMSSNGDLTGTVGVHIYGNQIEFNLGWGINIGYTQGQSTIGGDQANVIEYNSLGGIRNTGGNASWIKNNTMALNGCGQPATLANAVSNINGSGPGSLATCPTNPLGPGLWIGRDYSNSAAGPYNYSISRNQCDSNAGGCFWLETVTDANLWNNMAFNHTNTGYSYSTTFPGYPVAPPKSNYVIGTISASSISIVNDLQRGDVFANSRFPTAGAVANNALLDPEESTLNFAFHQTSVYANQNAFAFNVSAGNYAPYVVGAGAVWGAATMTAPAGGFQTVSAWPVLVQGTGYSKAAPTLNVVGGDSAFQNSGTGKPTLLTLTQSAGALTGCSVLQGGGPYNRTPLVSVQDSQLPGLGTGGAISVSLSGSPGTYTVASCSVTSPGSGYTRPIAGVAPVCATQPTVTATNSLGIVRISPASMGNYGPWTPGSTPPSVTVTLSDPAGTDFAGTPILWPINIGTTMSPNVVWGVVGVTIRDADHGHDMQTANSATATFSTPGCGGCSAATAVVFEGYVLNPTLTVTNAGSCDAGAPPWIVATNVPIASSNATKDRVFEQNISVTQPPSTVVFGDVLSVDSTHQDVNFVRISGNVGGEYCGALDANGHPTVGCTQRIYKSNNGTDSQYVEFNDSGTQYSELTHGSGALAAQVFNFGTGDGTAITEAEVGGTIQWQWDSSGNMNPSSANTTGTAGTSSRPIPSVFIGVQGSGTTLELTFPTAVSTGVLCETSAHKLGHCSSVVGAGGLCTCN